MKTNHLIKINFVLFSLLSVSHSAMASGILSNSKDPVSVAFSATCFAMDGVPIPEGTDAYSTCCDSATGGMKNFSAASPMPDVCKGLSTADAGAGAGSSIIIANTALTGASNMNGADSNGPGSLASASKGSGAATAQRSGVSSAGDGSGNETTPFNPTGLGAPGMSASGGGGSAGANGGSIGIASLGDGKKAAGEEGSGPNSAFTYTGGEKQGEGGPKGSAVNPGDLNELKFGGGAGGAGNTGAAGDGEATGSSIDPDDYFSRIKPGDNLFVIVHKRYQAKSPKMALVDLPKK